MQPTLHVLADHRAVLGEGPWWDAAGEVLYWVDVKAHQVHWTGLGGGPVGSLATPSDAGFAVKARFGGLLVGCRDGLYHHGTTGGGDWQSRWRGGWDTSAIRVNDGKTDRQGRLWFGTIHEPESAPLAHLYCAHGNLPQARLSGVTVSNGLGWSPDGRMMYHADSATQSIYAFDFDPASGQLRNRRVIASDLGRTEPDGLTVDADGCIWSAKWNGGRIVRYTPAGRIDREIVMPVSRPTSCMFVGTDLRLLAITTAVPDGAHTEALAGAVVLADVGVQGLPEQPFDDRARAPVST